jgi:hypothetical protein
MSLYQSESLIRCKGTADQRGHCTIEVSSTTTIPSLYYSGNRWEICSRRLVATRSIAHNVSTFTISDGRWPATAIAPPAHLPRAFGERRLNLQLPSSVIILKKRSRRRSFGEKAWHCSSKTVARLQAERVKATTPTSSPKRSRSSNFSLH